MSMRSTFEENIFLMSEKDLSITKLNTEVNRMKNEFKDLEEEIE